MWLKYNITLRLLRACAHELSVPLTMIFYKSLEEGPLPSVWLESIIVPLSKAKLRYDTMNYLPVSFTLLCCKTMEWVVAADLRQYLEFNGLLLSDTV